MPTTQCLIDGHNYRLDYDREDITSGRLYKGTLYTDRLLDFTFEVPSDKEDPLFSPSDTPDNVKGMIMSKVLEDDSGNS
jgi:hypothetical protein